jgi:predicted nucleic acid-binding protein
VTRYVIDASVLVKLVVPEDNSEKMRALAASFRAGVVHLLAPDFILTECANVLWKYARQTSTPAEEIQEAFRVLCDLGIEQIPHRTLLEGALALAAEYDRAVYDALYLVLARREGVPLITADERLVNALAPKGFALILLREWPSASEEDKEDPQ